jgi:hypothetical protein
MQARILILDSWEYCSVLGTVNTYAHKTRTALAKDRVLTAIFEYKQAIQCTSWCLTKTGVSGRSIAVGEQLSFDYRGRLHNVWCDKNLSSFVPLKDLDSAKLDALKKL